MKLELNHIHQKKFSLLQRLKSIGFALTGLKTVVNSEHNSWIHLFFTLLAGALGIVLHITKTELIVIVIVVAMVWTAELFNTCIEKILDVVATGYHPQVKVIKDIAAAAVLLTSLTAAIVGAIIFLPKIFKHAIISL